VVIAVFQSALPAAILWVVEVWTSNVRTKFTCVEWQHLTPVLFHGQLPKSGAIIGGVLVYVGHLGLRKSSAARY
jgi:hypothetical protein